MWYLLRVDIEFMLMIRAHSGYNPPKFVTDAAKEALDKVECNQYSPTKVITRHTYSNTNANKGSRGDHGSRKR